MPAKPVLGSWHRVPRLWLKSAAPCRTGACSGILGHPQCWGVIYLFEECSPWSYCVQAPGRTVGPQRPPSPAQSP